MMITAATTNNYNVIPMKTKKQVSMTGNLITANEVKETKSSLTSFVKKLASYFSSNASKDISSNTRNADELIDVVKNDFEYDHNGKISKMIFYRSDGTKAEANYQNGRYLDRTCFQ